jgi:hypothetical protein
LVVFWAGWQDFSGLTGSGSNHDNPEKILPILLKTMVRFFYFTTKTQRAQRNAFLYKSLCVPCAFVVN